MADSFWWLAMEHTMLVRQNKSQQVVAEDSH